ncbi:MAG: AAA family ATPase [Chitinophagaceae bacterium]|nr:AAA family ATPase [Chitinophagaceae bacterium]
MNNLYNKKVININNIFTDSFLDSRILYMYCFNALPSIHFIGRVEGEKVFEEIRERLSRRIKHVHKTKWYKQKKKGFEFDKTVIVCDNKCLIEIGNCYCEIFHDGHRSEFVDIISRIALQFKERPKRRPLDINLIVQNRNSMELKSMEIKRTKLDLELFYEDDFKEIDDKIRRRLNRNNDKGIVLLHGLPGTGKTTYLRNLVGRIKKKVLFLSPIVAGDLMNPEFIALLIDNPNTVVIIEDAENVIMDRKYGTGNAVSNLLNISDGLLSDFLNVQLICTFNSSLTMVDSALLRKGRLIAKYEFGKLGIEKARRLSGYFGFDKVIDRPMTIAEIAHPNEKSYDTGMMQGQAIGFRRHEPRDTLSSIRLPPVTHNP